MVATSIELATIFTRLADPSQRRAASVDLLDHLGAHEILVFHAGDDLPLLACALEAAPSPPDSTMLGFVAAAQRNGRHTGILSRQVGPPRSAAAYRATDESTLVIVGGAPTDAAVESCVAWLPLLTKALAREREGAGRSVVPRDASTKSSRVELLLAEIPALLAYIDCDHTYQLANGAYEAWVGIGADAIPGRRVDDVISRPAFDVLRPHIEAVCAGARVGFEAKVPYPTGERWIEGHYLPDLARDGTVRGFVAVENDITARKQAEERLAIIAEASKTLAATLDYDESLASAARIAVPALADWCVVYEATPEGAIEAIEVACADDVDRGLLKRAMKAQPSRPTPTGDAISIVLRTGRSILESHVTPQQLARSTTDEAVAALVALAPRSRMIVPLPSRSGMAGALTFVSRRARRYTVQDLALAEEIGRRAGIAIDNARSFENERITSGNLRVLACASDALTSSLDFEAMIQIVIQLSMPALGDFGFFDLAEADGGARRIAYAHEDPDTEALLARTKWVRSDRRDINVCALSSGEPAIHPYVDDAWLRRVALTEEHLAAMRELGFRSMITVPLPYQGRTIGALTLFYGRSGRHHTPADLEFAEEFARRAAPSVENARLYAQLKAAVVRQEEADRRKDEFLAMLGHELRNPLAPILTALQLMQLKLGDSAQKERTIIERQVQHLVRLVDDLLDVSRITRGRVELEKRPVDLVHVANKAIEMASPLLEQRKHKLDLEVRERAVVDGDEHRLAQIVSNLLTNAAKYTEPGGRITLSVDLDGVDAVLSVRDTGIGISSELLPRLFDLFVQGERALDRSQGGLGLGLAIVQSLVSMHGGRVFAKSDGPGRGSEFVVRLPRLRGLEESERLSEEDAASRSRRMDSRRVLVVDDNSDAADVLAEALCAAGHCARAAYDGPSALKIAAELEPEVALLDIGLPVMDGYELAERLQALPGLERIRLAALTGYGQAGDRDRSFAAGFDEHLVKPVDLDHIEAALRRLFEGPSGALSKSH